MSNEPKDLGPSAAHVDGASSARRIAADVARSSRRKLMCGALGISAVSILAACGSSGSDSGDKNGSRKGVAEGKKDDISHALAKVSDVPVGGGIVANGIVLVQPEKGEIVGFDAACPHDGAQLSKPEGKTITCPAHGSAFSVTDGSLQKGPAEEGLSEVKVEVRDGEVFRAT